MEKYNKYGESLNLDCNCKGKSPIKKTHDCGCGGINLPSHDNEIEILIRQLKREVKELDELVDELNNHPLYREYNNTLSEINNTYGIIESSLNNYFNKIMN